MLRFAVGFENGSVRGSSSGRLSLDAGSSLSGKNVVTNVCSADGSTVALLDDGSLFVSSSLASARWTKVRAGTAGATTLDVFWVDSSSVCLVCSTQLIVCDVAKKVEKCSISLDEPIRFAAKYSASAESIRIVTVSQEPVDAFPQVWTVKLGKDSMSLVEKWTAKGTKDLSVGLKNSFIVTTGVCVSSNTFFVGDTRGRVRVYCPEQSRAPIAELDLFSEGFGICASHRSAGTKWDSGYASKRSITCLAYSEVNKSGKLVIGDMFGAAFVVTTPPFSEGGIAPARTLEAVKKQYVFSKSLFTKNNTLGGSIRQIRVTTNGLILAITSSRFLLTADLASKTERSEFLKHTPSALCIVEDGILAPQALDADQEAQIRTVASSCNGPDELSALLTKLGPRGVAKGVSLSTKKKLKKKKKTAAFPQPPANHHVHKDRKRKFSK